jgi:Gamma-glutamyl cyclotransferase, AIG2-like
MANYVFGYGSLMEKASRTRTEPKAVDAYPAIIGGYKRGWYNRDPATIGFQPTFLGVVPFHDAVCNGVIFPVTDEQLIRFNEREKGYHTETITGDKVELLDGRPWLEPDATVYIYVTDNQVEPNFEYPIVQSYLDICVNGCLELEGMYPIAKNRQFTDIFFLRTYGWNEYWVNDRIYPRRPHVYQPNARTIDKLIYKHYPNEFNKIQLEPASPQGNAQVIVV